MTEQSRKEVAAVLRGIADGYDAAAETHDVAVADIRADRRRRGVRPAWAAPGRYRPRLVHGPGGKRMGVHVTNRGTGETFHVVAVCGITSFPPDVAGRICDRFQHEGWPPPRMRLLPLPKPTCICGWPPGEHAPNCHIGAGV